MSAEKTYKILCIEDMAVNRELLKMILDRRNDLTVSFAENGYTGIEEAKSIQPDLILLDISLPDISGIEVLKILKNSNETAHIPTIAISGDILPKNSSHPDHSFDKFLPKPINVMSLYAAIDELLEI
jgi:CheY-like chemotaxis protein